jgi:hypothetical protein
MAHDDSKNILDNMVKFVDTTDTIIGVELSENINA